MHSVSTEHIWTLVSAWRKHFKMKLTFFNSVSRKCAVTCPTIFSVTARPYFARTAPPSQFSSFYCCWSFVMGPVVIYFFGSRIFQQQCQSAFHSQRLHLINHINYNYQKKKSWRILIAELTGKCVLLSFFPDDFSANFCLYRIYHPPPLTFTSENPKI